MPWRVLNDNKRFVDDWHTFVKRAREWQRVHPLTKLDNWLHENYKDRMRTWWFSLSKYEQDKLFSIRKDTGQYAISHFPGPKYQRGNFAMFPAGSTSITAVGETLSLSSANNAAFNIDVSPPGPLDGGFGCLRDGTLDRTNSAGQVQINSSTDWITPRNGTIGDGWEVKWNLLTGSFNDENFTEDTWTTISVTGRGRYVGESTDTPASSSTFEFDIGEDGTSTSDVNQDYSVEVGDLI